MILEIVLGCSKYSHDTMRREEHKKSPTQRFLGFPHAFVIGKELATKPLLRSECLRRRLNVQFAYTKSVPVSHTS